MCTLESQLEPWNAGTFARIVGGEVLGDASVEITGLGGIDTAEAGDLVFAESRKYVEAALKCRCAAIITRAEFAAGDKPLILVEEPRLAFLKALEFLAPEPQHHDFIHPTAVIASDAKIGENVQIGAFVSVGSEVQIGSRVIIEDGVRIGDGCTIGDDTTIKPNTVLYPRMKIGRRCLIHANVVIGSDGYGFMPVGHGIKKVPHIGIVRIDDDVEIGAGCCIDRAKTAETIIGMGTKLDNLVHVGHNVRIGRFCLILANVTFGGTSVVEDGAIISGGAVVTDHVTVGAKSLVGGNSGVRYDVPPGGRVFGTPAVPLNQRLREVSMLQKLPENLRHLRQLEERVSRLEGASQSEA
jgi:UDP-3-O-[3-hydroxymyristoyl] glucosamine N-acyltransferase